MWDALRVLVALVNPGSCVCAEANVVGENAGELLCACNAGK